MAQAVLRAMVLCSIAVTVGTSVLLERGQSFHVALDERRIQALQHKFTVLEFPTRRCNPLPEESGLGGVRSYQETWNPHCVYGLTKYLECEYNGYQYSMEWYFMQMLRDNHQYIADQPDDASFVYFPQCVSQVYFALRASNNMTHWAAIAAAETEYLIPLLKWAHGTALHRRHDGRNFWTVFSMDLGRQDFPRSAAWLDTWSIGSLTGSEKWTVDSGILFNVDYKLNHDPRNTAKTWLGDCWDEDTAPVTLANEMFPARNFRSHDTVISIPSRFSPDARSRRFGGRPTLVFFAGSPNSCARKRVIELYSGAPGFDVSTNLRGDAEYRSRMLSARYCLVMRGSSHTNNVRLYDVLAHGCVPVIVSDDFQPPLDAWLPWSDIAIFLPTASIPDLAHILQNHFGETARWHYFHNVVVGTGHENIESGDAIVAKSSAKFDRSTLWGGLSAARIFDWHRSDFWLLFFADVAWKLTARIQRVVTVSPRDVMKHALELPNHRSHDISVTDTEGDLTSGGASSLLLAALRLVYHKSRWQKNEVIVDCCAESDVHTWKWLASFGEPAPSIVRSRANADQSCCSHATRQIACNRQQNSPSVLSLASSAGHLKVLRQAASTNDWMKCGWRGGSIGSALSLARHGLLRLAQSHYNQVLRRVHGTSDPDVFVARVTDWQCKAMFCRIMREQDPNSLRTKFLWFPSSRADKKLRNHRSVPQCTGSHSNGWLCFHLKKNGQLQPLFPPFLALGKDGSSDPFAVGDVLCGREDDPDLDTVLHLLDADAEFGTSVRQQPSRWGAFLEGHGVGAPIALPSTAHGRFFHYGGAQTHTIPRAHG